MEKTETELKKPEIKEKPKKKEDFWTIEERKNCKDNYACEIIVSNGTPEEIYNPQTPNDAFVVRYTVDNKQVSDLTRGTKSKIFDMYWDKFKSGLKSIDYGKGTIKPNLWNYQTAPTKKKKRKG
tara:strand:+ start:164 stop:535 length:372 start_codon:yes stop_codon:yes gene_type:complete